MATATHIPIQLAADITETLARLRQAREVGDKPEESAAERRLDWLLSRINLVRSDRQSPAG